MVPRSRRRLLAEASAAAFLALGAAWRSPRALSEDRRLRASEPDQRRRRRQQAIQKGCAYLATKQRLDGGFGEDKAVVALTALSSLALMAGGSASGRGPHGRQVAGGIQFLVGLIENPASRDFFPEGYFNYQHDSDSKMHGQGYAALALAMALGTADGRQSEGVRKALVKAVRCMEEAQTLSGGYGYEPLKSTMHEGSVTVCVAQALRAARDGGLLVNDKVVQRGLRYLKESQISSKQADDGGFRYSQTQSRHSYALTAAALSSFFLFGQYADDKERTIERGLAYLMRHLGEDDTWYFYGHFYAAWALWQRDGADWRGETLWGTWQARIYPELLGKQHADGSWDDEGTFRERFVYGPILATAFSVLTLAIPDESLPIFQR